MGNIDSTLSTISEEIEQSRNSSSRGRFVINFISASDIPAADFMSNSDPYLKAYLCKPTDKSNSSGNTNNNNNNNNNSNNGAMNGAGSAPSNTLGDIVDGPQYTRISDIVQTPRRNNCTNALWNCYRDLRMDPPENSYLMIELHDWSPDKVDKDPIGSVVIGVEIFSDESPHSFLFNFHKVGNPKKNPQFSVTVRRAFIHAPAPIQKTIFIIRHGESKWNKAQASGNMLTTILDRDHPLTDRGVRQSERLRRHWKDEEDNLRDHHFDDTSVDASAAHSLTLGPLSPTEHPIPTATNTAAATPSTPSHVFADSRCLEADLLGLDSPEFADVVTKTTLDSTSQANDTTPALSPPIASLASSPFTHDSVMQHFAPNEEQQQQQQQKTAQKRDTTTVTTTTPANAPTTPAGNNNNSQSNGNGNGDDDDNANDDEDSDKEEGNEEEAEMTRRESFSDLAKQSAKIGEKFQRAATLNEIKSRRKDYNKMFIEADFVYCSPLTRAIETALIGLQGHRALQNHGLILSSTIREIKGVGGLDSVGVAAGAAIAERVASELESKVGKARAEQLLLDPIFVNDAAFPWWTNISSFDNKFDQHERVGEFISFARYCEAKTPIFVGHSLFFKFFYSKRLSDYLSVVRPELSENMKKARLGNANVLALTILFSSDDDTECTILDADLLFGGNFQKHTSGGDQSTNNTPMPNRSGGILKSSGLSGLSTVLEKASNFANALQSGLFEEDAPARDRNSLTNPPPTSFTESLSSFAKKVINSGNL